jgi:signal transduction histidine kinase
MNNLIENAIKYTPAGGSIYVNVLGDATARSLMLQTLALAFLLMISTTFSKNSIVPITQILVPSVAPG